MKTQAWGWLTAAVLAAGLNSSYHNGGMPWAHEIADRIQHNTGAVFALATGRADQFLAEARMLKVDQDVESATVADEPQCPFAAALATAQKTIDQSQSQFDRFQALSDREQAQMDRIEASRVRIENRVGARLARIRIPDANFAPVVRVQRIDCPRVHVNIPRMPRVQVPAPEVHVEFSGTGPV